MKTLIKGVNFGISMLLVLAAVAIAYIAIPAFGNKALIVRSGSMQPTIKVGDLVVVQTQKGLLSPLPTEALREGGNKYKEGDIVAFSSQKNQKLFTTHRIIGKEIKDGKIFYQTKGDANNSADNNLVAEENVIGKNIVRLPYFGKLFAFAKSNIGFPLLIIFPALLVIILEMVNIYKEIKRQNRIIEVPMPKENFAGLKIIIPVFMSVMVMHNAFAYFSDTETSTGNVFTASSVFPSPTPTPGPSPTPSPTPSPSPVGIANHVVISEVQINGGPGDADHDFIEFYNPTNSAFDLNGHRLVRRTGNSSNDDTIKSWTSSTLIPAHGFYLWANNSESDFPSSIGADTSTSLDLTSSHSIALRNGPEDTGTIVDALSWNDGSTFGEGDEFDPDPGADQSIERKALSTSDATSMTTGSDVLKGNGFDTGNNATDFILRSLSQPQNTSSPTEAL